MNSSLRKYLDEHGAQPVDPAVIAAYEKSMREVTIPKIIEDMKANARAVAKIRLVPLFGIGVR